MTRAPSNHSTDHNHSEIQDAEFRSFVESINDYAVFTLDPGGHVSSWNAGAQRLTGYAESEVLGQHFSRFYLPEDIASGKPGRALAVASSVGRFEDEAWRLRKDGSRFLANVLLTAIHDKAGALRGFAKVTRDVTERKAPEDALRAANATLQSIFDAAPVAVLSFDLQGRVKHWSAGAERMFGWTAAEAMGRICPAVPEEGMADFLAMVARVAESGAEQLVRIRQKKNGQRVDAKLSPAPLRNRDGVTAEVMVILEDITEKLRTDDALRQSEARLASLIDIAADAIISVDASQRIRIFNQGAESIFGYRAAEMFGQPLDVLLPARFADRHRRHVQDFAAAPEAARLMGARREVFGRRKDGSEFPAEASISKQDIGGQITSTVILRDITERKRVESALCQSERELRLFTLATNDAFWTWDLLTGRVDRSIGFEKNFGYRIDSIEPVIGWWKERVHPDDREKVMTVFHRTMEEKPEYCLCVYRFKRHDGTFATVEERVYLVRDEAGVVTRALGAMTDITERVEQQEAAREVSRRVMMAEENERRRIAKELHDSTAQDLVAVILNLETLREAAAPGNPVQAKQIEDCIALLENSAHEIRTLSYLLHPPRLDEAGLPDAIRHYVAGFGERTGIRVRVELPMEGVRLHEDVELTLFRVVQESLGNIYRHAQSPTATVRLVHQEGVIRLEIRDEGVGIPPHVLAAPGGQASGFGVGLPSMRERLRQIGGCLEVESTGHGTIVRAVLPATSTATG